MANMFLGFPVPRAKIAEMIEGAAPPLKHIENHRPPGSDPLVLPGDIETDQLIKWDGSKFIGIAEPSGGIATPYDDHGFYFKTFFPTLDNLKQSTNNDAAITHTPENITLNTGAVSTSYALIRLLNDYQIPVLTFDRILKLRTRIYCNSFSDASGDNYLIIGGGASWKHLGFAIWNGYIQSTVHNGSSRRQVHLKSVSTGGAFHDLLLELVFYPGESCKFYINGVLEGTETQTLPSGAFYNTWFITIGSQNVSTTNNLELQISQIEIYQPPA